MDFDRIREFVVLTEECSFQKAADACGVHKATLSRHIRDLELELGVPLFDRTTQKVTISEYGTIFLPYALQLLQKQAEIMTESSMLSKRLKNQLSVGLDPIYAKQGIALLSEFERENKDIVLTAFVDIDLAVNIQTGKCDAIILHASDLIVNADVSVLSFKDDCLVAILPEKHPLAGEQEITLSQLKEDIFILLNPNSSICREVITACQNHGFEPKVKYSSTRVDDIIDLVSKGVGITFLTRGPMENRQESKIKLVDITPPFSIKSLLVYRKDNHSPSLTRFLAYFQDHIDLLSKS